MSDIRIRTVAGRPVPQINVKDRANYYSDPEIAKIYAELGAATVEEIYDGVQFDFWEFVAPQIAHERGYGAVFGNGRSSGWLYVPNPYGFDEGWHDDEAKRGFYNFASAIDEAVGAAQEMFLQRLKEAHADLERRRDENTIRSNN
jgi:hypothetical protein